MEVRCIEGPALPQDQVININAYGMVNSKRQADDHHIYFGTSAVSNDIVCNDIEYADKHFFFKYKERRNTYVVKDIGESTGTFVQV